MGRDIQEARTSSSLPAHSDDPLGRVEVALSCNSNHPRMSWFVVEAVVQMKAAAAENRDAEEIGKLLFPRTDPDDALG